MPGKRGPKITLEAKRMIRKAALKTPYKRRTVLAEELQSQFEKNNLSFPTVETLERLISQTRNQRDELDKLWSLVALPDYPMPSEAIPVTLKVWARAIEQDEPLTIRQALWVGRLYCFHRTNREKLSMTGNADIDKKTIELNNRGKLLDIDDLCLSARTFALNEKLLRLEDDYPDTTKEMLHYWLDDFSVYLSAGEQSKRVMQKLETISKASKGG
jgi:hypothetical protein